MSAAYATRRSAGVIPDRITLTSRPRKRCTRPIHSAVALGEVVVDRDDVHAVAGDGVEVGRQHTGQGLALTGLHLGDIAEVQCRAAHDLHLVVLLVEDSPGRLAGDGERLGQQLVERLTIGVALAELVGLGLELIVGQAFDLGRQ